jgi:hypothetical protein
VADTAALTVETSSHRFGLSEAAHNMVWRETEGVASVVFLMVCVTGCILHSAARSRASRMTAFWGRRVTLILKTRED